MSENTVTREEDEEILALKVKVALLESQLAQSTESYRELEPCGHAKNFLIGDEHGRFTCTVCRMYSAESQLAGWRALGADSPHALSVVMDAAMEISKLREQRLTEARKDTEQFYNLACRTVEYLKSTPRDIQTCLGDDLQAAIDAARNAGALRANDAARGVDPQKDTR